MASLLTIAELEWRNLFPIGREKTGITKEEFIATAKVEYSAAMWIYRQEQINTDGFFDMPTDLLTEVELPVENDAIDIKDLKYLSALPGDLWLQNVGGMNCECKYLKTTINLVQLLCDDDSMDENTRTVRVQGKKLIFDKGVHKNTLTIIYANTGEGLDPSRIEVNDYVASKVRMKLKQLYSDKKEADVTNDQNVNK